MTNRWQISTKPLLDQVSPSCMVSVIQDEPIGLIPSYFINSLAPSDAVWRQRSGSTLAHVMVCCLRASSHYLNQCWLINTKVFWHSSEGIIMRRSEDTFKENKNEILFFKITYRSPKDQWIKSPVLATHSISRNKQPKAEHISHYFWIFSECYRYLISLSTSYMQTKI